MHTVAATAAWMQFTSRSFSFSSLTGTKEAAKEGKLTRMEAASTPHFSWCSLFTRVGRSVSGTVRYAFFSPDTLASAGMDKQKFSSAFAQSWSLMSDRTSCLKLSEALYPPSSEIEDCFSFSSALGDSPPKSRGETLIRSNSF